MNELRKYNLNSYVHVALDSKGLEILKDRYSRFNVDIDLDHYKSDKKEGLYKFQFWHFMSIFGEHTNLAYAPFSPQVFLEEKDL